MTYPRQLIPTKASVHDPLWSLPNNFLVDGVANGITDGTGGVVFLSGFENNNSTILDESRFGISLAISASRGQNNGAGLAGLTSFANNPTDSTGLATVFGDTGNPHLQLATGVNTGTAFTFEGFWRRPNTPVTPNRGDFLGINIGNGAANYYGIRLQDPGSTGYDIVKDFSNAIFFSSINELMDTAWHHFCVENKVPGVGNRTLSFYVDGVLKLTQSVTMQQTATPNRIVIYINQGNTPGQFNVDEVRLTKGMYRYGAPFTPPSTPFIRG